MMNRNELPEGWVWKKLGEVCEKIANGSPAKQFEEKVGLPISRIETIWNGQIDYDRIKYVKECDPEFVNKYALKNKDILFSHINSDIHLGKTAIFSQVPQHQLIHGINLLLLRTNELISPDFFNYQLKFLRARGKFISIAQKSVNQSSINQAKLRQVELILPPLLIQHAIVTKIEEIFNELDHGVAQLKTTREQLKVYRQAVLKWAFEGRLTNAGVKEGELPEGELPEGWKWVKLGEILESVRNGYSKKPDDNGLYKILRISSVRPGKVDLSDVRFLNDKIDEVNEINENDLLFTRYNGSIDYVGVCGRVPKLNDKIYYPDKLIRCRPVNKEPFHAAYLEYASNSGLPRAYVLSKIKTTAGQTGISGNEIKQIPIPLAPLAEQHLIVSEIERRLSVCDKMEEVIGESLRQAEVLRQGVLKRAFEGKLL